MYWLWIGKRRGDSLRRFCFWVGESIPQGLKPWSVRLPSIAGVKTPAYLPVVALLTGGDGDGQAVDVGGQRAGGVGGVGAGGIFQAVEVDVEGAGLVDAVGGEAGVEEAGGLVGGGAAGGGWTGALACAA